jgi:hypothetical protein
MLYRHLAILIIVICSNVISQETKAQTDALSLEQIRAAATELSARAATDVKQADFQKYEGTAGLLIAEGDSWFDYPFYDVLQNLEGVHQFKVESTAHKGDTLESIVYELGQLSGLALKMSRLAETGKMPVAILLSGGGNDIAGPELTLLLNHAKSGLPKINERIVAGVFDVRLRTSYLTFIQAVTNLSNLYFKRSVPVLIHGYDYPIPDGRGYAGGWGFLPGPWFKPYFEQKGYNAVTENAATLKVLVDRFNSIIEAIPKQPGYEHVCYVPVKGTLSPQLVPPQQYQSDWGNELHPTRTGFRKVAAKFNETIDNCARKK